jgi:hypothetical protein
MTLPFKNRRDICEYFVLCDKPVTTYVKHPTIGLVPCCEKCADFSELAKVPLEEGRDG